MIKVSYDSCCIVTFSDQFQDIFIMMTEDSGRQLFKSILIVFDKENLQTREQVESIINLLKREERFQIFYHSIKEKFIKKKTQMLLTFQCSQYQPSIIPNYVIVVGNGQLLLNTISMFQGTSTPPILTIAKGVESFNFNFQFSEIHDLMPLFIEEIKHNKIHTQKLMKICVKSQNGDFIGESASQVEIHRGSCSSVLKLNIYLKNKCVNEVLLAQLWGDGILIATPMGSTGRSMLLNGPIMFKQMRSLLLVPICPLSLKFRPSCLPADCQIIIQVNKESRASGSLSIDGNFKRQIPKGQRISIAMSQENVQMIIGLTRAFQETWVNGLKEVLNWAQNYSSFD